MLRKKLPEPDLGWNMDGRRGGDSYERYGGREINRN